MRVGFVGAGRLATALAHELDHLVAEAQITAVTARSAASAETLAGRLLGAQAVATAQDVANRADLVIIATPDDAIASVASSIAWRPGQMAVHCSGAQSAAALSAAAVQGALTGVLHPLQTLAGREPELGLFRGITFAVEAPEPLAVILQWWAQALGGRWITLRPEDRVLYHAAAVIASNYLVTLAKLASGLWEEMGIGRAEALRALLPLMHGTVENLERVGLPDGLTGPIARGDLGTVERHLAAVGERAPQLLAVYRELGLQTVPLAEELGRVNAGQAAALRNALAGTKAAPASNTT